MCATVRDSVHRSVVQETSRGQRYALRQGRQRKHLLCVSVESAHGGGLLLGYGCRFLVHAMQHEHEHDHEREIKNSALLGWKKDLAVPFGQVIISCYHLLVASMSILLSTVSSK